MSSALMSPVPCFYDESPLVSDQSSAYTRANIRTWLEHWPDFFMTELAETRITWVTAKVDLLAAVGELSDCLVTVFNLVSVRQMAYREAASVMGVSEAAVKRYWRALVSDVQYIMLDRTIYPQASIQRRCNYISAGYAVSCEGQFPPNPDH